MRIRRLPQAIRDADEIFLYIARDNPAAADRMVDRITDAAERLRDFPRSGAPRPEAGKGLRGITIGPYILYYRIVGDVIEVVRVLHGARDISALPGGF